MNLLRALLGAVAVLLLGVLLLPVALLVLVSLLLLDLVVPRARRKPAALLPRDTTAASVMILNWNGRAFLERLLPSLDAAIATHGGAHEVIVIDNGSTDDSVAWVRAHFPHVRLVQHARNEKFVRGYNLALTATNKDVVILLNNDMVVDRHFLRPLLDGLAAHPQAFAVSAQIAMQDPEQTGIETGRTAGYWSGGMFKLAHLPVPENATGTWPCLWPGGGSSAVDRRALLAAGGFEALYDPYYFEDASLGYQAWKRGLSVLLAPQARVEHAHRGSSSRLRPRHLERVQRRNAHLFVWRSFDDVRLTITAAGALPLTGVRMALRRGFGRAVDGASTEALAIGSALLRLPQALRARAAMRRVAVRTDREVLALAHSRHRSTRALGERPEAGAPLRLLMLLARVPRRDADGSWVQFELLKRLGERHHVTVLALAETPAIASRASELAPHVARIETLVLTREAARVDLLRQDPAGFRRDYSDARIRARVAEVLAVEAFDVVQVDYIEMAYLVEGLLHDTASVHVVHEPLARVAWTQQGGGLRAAHERARAVNLERRLLAPYARVVCMSEPDAHALRASHPKVSPVVITNGIDAARFLPSEVSHAPTMLFVGSYAHTPNVDAAEFAAREILPRVRAQVPDARLCLVGHDADGRLKPLRALEGVEIVGRVDDLASAVRAAGCFVAPLRTGGGMRSKILEALAWAKPVIGTPCAFTGIAGAHDAHYLVGEDADTLAAASVRVLTDAALRQRLGAAARQLVEQRHRSDVMTSAYEALYRELVATAVRP